MLANIALALELPYTASEDEIIAKAHSLLREINTLRVRVKRPTKRAADLPKAEPAYESYEEWCQDWFRLFGDKSR